jgi:hypothetical protein
VALKRCIALGGALVVVGVATIGCGADGETRTVTVGAPTPSPARPASPVERPLPRVTRPDPRASLARPSPSTVVGGGPSGDAAAVARIEAQFPVVPGDLTLTGAAALSYADRLANAIPGLGALRKLTKVGSCATRYGLVGAKAYVTPDYARDQVTDRYYVFAGGTNPSWCELVRAHHRNFNIQPVAI